MMLLRHGLCKDVPVFMHGQVFFLFNCTYCHWGGCDLVLGTQWISTSCIINWDFKHLTMEFAYGSRHIVLHGIKAQPTRSKLQDGAKFFREPTRKVIDSSDSSSMLHSKAAFPSS